MDLLKNPNVYGIILSAIGFVTLIWKTSADLTKRKIKIKDINLDRALLLVALIVFLAIFVFQLTKTNKENELRKINDELSTTLKIRDKEIADIKTNNVANKLKEQKAVLQSKIGNLLISTPTCGFNSNWEEDIKRYVNLVKILCENVVIHFPNVKAMNYFDRYFLEFINLKDCEEQIKFIKKDILEKTSFRLDLER